MRKQIFRLLLVLLLIGVVAYFVLDRSKKKADAASTDSPPPAASVAPVTRGTISSNLRVAGQFTPYQEVDLHAKVSGYIRRINVDIGDRVRLGEVIATLEVPELNAQVAGAQAEVRHSQSEIVHSKSEVSRAEANHTPLHAAYVRLEQAAQQRPGLIAQQELDDARAKDQNAEAQIDAAQANLEAVQQQLGVSQADNLRVQTLSDYSIVTAPFTGVVTRRYADTGSLIQAGTASNTQAMPVVRVAQSDLLRLRMPVPEGDVRYIHTGGLVQVTVQAVARTFEGRVVRFTRDLDSSTRTMLAEVDVPNRDLSLSPGMYAETQIVLQKHDNALSIPSQAIITDTNPPAVLVLDDSHHVERRTVTTGIQGQNRIEILSGLNEGASVITSGQSNYQEGELVRPQSGVTSKSGQQEGTS